jgi:hypothetical protein
VNLKLQNKASESGKVKKKKELLSLKTGYWHIHTGAGKGEWEERKLTETLGQSEKEQLLGYWDTKRTWNCSEKEN